ncbi:hypothetical protein B0H15DRAFT_150344 [Mycena belliarum]|uniref:Uncharacterized protein n=1 Tax=Mycena belliarum TaxID=1033014 RepID=A0AAD6XTB9_9AGAR|nr:hypothetical protein B0H15DRAFT_150344 [Mycena belliae]
MDADCTSRYIITTSTIASIDPFLYSIHDLSLPDAQAGKSHCWLHVSSNLGCKAKKCRYFHPHDPVPYRKHTPCPGWATCGGRGGCPFKHPEQLRNGPGPGRPAALLTPRGLVNQWAAVPCFGGIPNVNLARPQYAVYN